MAADTVEAFIALGANMGEAQSAVRRAMDAIDALPHTRVLRRSSLYRSTPVQADGDDYVNAVVQVQTGLEAHALLRQLQAMEQQAGRQRSYTNAPRPLDLDVLLYADQRIQTDMLTVPHPRMQVRAFVLVPLSEIAPQRVSKQDLRAVADQGIWRIGPA